MGKKSILIFCLLLQTLNGKKYYFLGGPPFYLRILVTCTFKKNLNSYHKLSILMFFSKRPEILKSTNTNIYQDSRFILGFNLEFLGCR